MRLAFKNEDYIAFNKSKQYGFNKVVYIRSSKEHTQEKIGGYMSSIIGNAATNQNRAIREELTRGFQTRGQKELNSFYKNRTQWLQSKGLITGTDSQKEYQNIMNHLTDLINDNLISSLQNTANLSSQFNTAKSTAGKASSKFLGSGRWYKLENGDKFREASTTSLGRQSLLKEITNSLESIEESINKDKDLLNYINLLSDSKQQAIGIVTNEQQIKFQHLRNNIDKLNKNIMNAKAGSDITEIMGLTNNTMGAMAEIVNNFSLAHMNNSIGSAFESLGAISTGDEKPTVNLTGGKISFGQVKPDSILSFSTRINEQEVEFDIGVSVKTSSALEKGSNSKMNITFHTLTDSFIDLLKKINFNTAKNKTAVYNTVFNALVWYDKRTSEVQMINRAIMSSFMIKAITGTQTNFQVNGKEYLDVTDIIVINGQAYPMYQILNKVVNAIGDNNQTSGTIQYSPNKISSKFIEPTKEEFDKRVLAFKRSNNTYEIFKTLTVIFRMTPQQLKSYLK